jgi:hypothetical protein
MISAAGILLSTTANFRPCSGPFLSNSLTSLDERFLTHLFLRFEPDLSDGLKQIIFLDPKAWSSVPGESPGRGYKFRSAVYPLGKESIRAAGKFVAHAPD